MTNTVSALQPRFSAQMAAASSGAELNDSAKQQGILLTSEVPMDIQIWPIDKLLTYARDPRKNDGAVDRIAGAFENSDSRFPVWSEVMAN